MTGPDREAEFEAFLKHRTLLPDIHDELEPPGELDDIVLKKARAAIRGRQQPGRGARWAVPVALAATLLLCLSVVLNVRLNTNRPPASKPEPPLPASAASNAPPAPTVAPMAANAPPPPDVAPMAANTPPPPDVAPMAANAPPPPDSALADAARADAEGKAAPPALAKAPALEARSANAAEPSRRALAKRQAADVAEPTRKDPKSWLEHIAALRAQGEIAEADAEMQRFRAAFPTYSAKPTAAPSPGQPK